MSKEILLNENDFIVSKTDIKGKITYCNQIFMNIAGYREDELLGQPHNIIRHPDMPRSVFRFLWQTLQAGKEFFGLVKNLTKQGNYYWVFANVTPSYDVNNQLVGYYSVRRCPKRSSIELLSDLYQQMLQEENRHSSAKVAMDSSLNLLVDTLQSTGQNYNEFVLSLEK